MEASGHEASFRSNQRFRGLADLPPKKRTLKRGRTIVSEWPERNNFIPDVNTTRTPSFLDLTSETQPVPDSSETQPLPDLNFAIPHSSETPPFFIGIEKTAPENHPKETASCDQLPPKADAKPEITQKEKDTEPPIKLFSYINKGEEEGSSKPLVDIPLPMFPPPTRNSAACKLCGMKFPATQALENAHKKEKEMKRVMKAAQEDAAILFFDKSLGTAVPLYQSSYNRQPFRYSPHHEYANTGWQSRPLYSNPRTGLVQGTPGFPQVLEGFDRPSFIKQPVNPAYEPGWRKPYIHAPVPIRSPRGTTNFDQLAAPDLTTSLHVWENEDGLAKKQSVESTGFSFSFKSKRNKSLELDLTLKL